MNCCRVSQQTVQHLNIKEVYNLFLKPLFACTTATDSEHTKQKGWMSLLLGSFLEVKQWGTAVESSNKNVFYKIKYIIKKKKKEHYCCCESYFSLVHLFLYQTLKQAKILVCFETPLSLPSFPFFPLLVGLSALIWAARVGGCQSDTSAAPPPAWSCPPALAAQWWGPTSFSQSAHSLLSSPHSSSLPECRRQCARDDPGFPSVPLHPHVAGSAAFAYLPMSA